jgi:hypothetical protein
MINCPKCGNPNFDGIAKCVHCQHSFTEVLTHKKSNSTLYAAIIVILVIFLFTIFFGFLLFSVKKESDFKNEILDKVEFDFSSKRGGFGTILKLDLDLHNKSQYTVKDFVVVCSVYASSGTRIDEVSAIVYEQLSPNQKKEVKDINFGFIHSQADDFRCGIDNLTVVK